MSTDGILEYQGTKRVLFRGDTSNIVFDTRTTSLGIGVTGSNNPSSNLYITGNAYVSSNLAIGGLHFECNHDANVASIKLNSNVVTEFSRSKKLIKYPRVALTSASDNAYENGYKITYSSHYPGDHYPHEAFDNEKGSGSLTLWYSGNNNHYNTSDGSAITDPNNADVAPKLDTNTDYGDWIGIELPNAIELKYFDLYQQYNTEAHFPQSATIYARKLTSDSWTEIYRYDDASRENEPNRATRFTVDSIVAYKYFALVGRQRNQETTGSNGISLGQWELYGVPEYDPEAYGTDAVVKSVPNVPNTDWLEVYYDAKSYSTLPDSVNDESGSTNTFNGTIPSGHQITFDDGDIKAFVFPGRDSTTPLQYPDYIQTTLSGWSDNQPHTQSCWFKPASITSFDQVFGLWDVASTNYEYSAFGIYTDKFAYYHFGSEFQYPYDVSSLIGTWCHISAIHTGYIPDTKVYLNGHLLSGSRTQGSDNTLSLGTAPKLALGKDPGRGNASQEWAFHGSIANYRLFNRALTSDEIYQLYAYQKEYFGHGDLSMTFKAGRLGIGTSEPRAMLDVRGEIRAIGSMFYLLDTPIQNEWYWSGSTSTTGAEVKVIYSQLPDNCRAVYADVFLPQASANDHGSHTLGRDHKRIGALWTAGRSSTTDNQPTVYMGDGLSQGSNVVFISQPGQNDTEYYFGNWWPSLTIPLAPGNVLYHGRNGFGGTGGWILVYVKGYYI